MQTIPNVFIEEAFEYALKSREYTSNRHDFHEGGLDAKQQKMFEGKLGENFLKCFFSTIAYRLMKTTQAMKMPMITILYCQMEQLLMLKPEQRISTLER